MKKYKLVETHYATDHSLGDGEYETRWWVRRSIWVKYWIFGWFFSDLQIIRKNQNQVIQSAFLGYQFQYDKYWKAKFAGKPDEVKHK